MRSTPPTRSELLQLLHDGLVQMQLNYTRDTENQLIRFIELIHLNNKAMHLTSIRDLDVMVSRHLLDSLSIAPYINSNCVLDVGTGAGLPGVPLAIALPQCQFVLLDNQQKKIRFLQQVGYKMHLKNVQIVHDSIEHYQPEKLFETIVCRSFGIFPDFLYQVQSLLKPGGRVLAMRGVYPETEIAQIKPPFQLLNAYPLHIPLLNAERHLIEVVYTP